MSPRPWPAIDLIIPARDEAGSLPVLLARLPRHALRRVIVVDNGSTDGTAAAARAGGATVVAEPTRGYGAACLAGLRRIEAQAALRDVEKTSSPPDAVAFIDADLSDDPAWLPRLCEPIAAGTADLVLASRPRLAEPAALTLPQRVGNAIACVAMERLTGQRYSDLGPMRVIRWPCLRRLEMADTTWGWTLEMQYKAAVAGLRVVEVEVPYRRRHAGRSKISGSVTGSVRAGGKIVWTLARLRWQTRREARPPLVQPQSAGGR